jgi:YfiH family protein
MIVASSDSSFFYSTLFPKIYSHGFGTKKLGDGRTAEVRSSMISKNKIVAEHIIIPSQSHSSNVEIADGNVKTYYCDGVITDQKGVLLTVITADCVPIIFVDIQKGIVGISHQGWKGTLDKLPELMVEKMVILGAKKDDITCVIGPSINDCCYEIYGEREEQYRSSFGEDVFRKQGTKSFLNLCKANHQTLQAAGISSEHIDFFPFCTSCDSSRFFSYYRDKGLQGEMISFIITT